MKKLEFEKLIKLANECHRGTLANKEGWLVVEKNKEEAALKFIAVVYFKFHYYLSVVLLFIIFRR